jgi:SAM-dependent methyltransferase
MIAGGRAMARDEPVDRIARSGRFGPDDVELIHRTYFDAGPARGGPWDAFRDAHMQLPDWFRSDLDPYGADYAAQQHRLWQSMAGVDRDYDVAVDEKEAEWGDVDPVRSPGFFVRRDPEAIASASDHVIATGMLLKHCGLESGDWALEYGAGFGQTALTLARLGVNVDTVDVSATFCRFVRDQATFFGVPMTAFEGRFGDAPRSGQRYDLVWFYESFHHCLDFVNVVRRLPQLLAPGGRIILGGEPIVERPNAAVPYPWGVRLHSEVAAVVRRQRWFELGFTEDFLFELFAHAGFVMKRVDCEPSLFGRLYIAEYRPAEVSLAVQWMPDGIRGSWRSVSPRGARPGAGSRWPIEVTDHQRTVELTVTNGGLFAAGFRASAGRLCIEALIPPRSTRTIAVVVPPGTNSISIDRRSGLDRILAAPLGLNIRTIRDRHNDAR